MKNGSFPEELLLDPIIKVYQFWPNIDLTSPSSSPVCSISRSAWRARPARPWSGKPPASATWRNVWLCLPDKKTTKLLKPHKLLEAGSFCLVIPSCAKHLDETDNGDTISIISITNSTLLLPIIIVLMITSPSSPLPS